jgi:hypothetical protein
VRRQLANRQDIGVRDEVLKDLAPLGKRPSSDVASTDVRAVEDDETRAV